MQQLALLQHQQESVAKLLLHSYCQQSQDDDQHQYLKLFRFCLHFSILTSIIKQSITSRKEKNHCQEMMKMKHPYMKYERKVNNKVSIKAQQTLVHNIKTDPSQCVTGNLYKWLREIQHCKIQSILVSML
jgi:hypothetical protein